MKKILSFIIIAAMLFAVCGVSASALVPPATREELEYEAFRTYCLEENAEPGALAEVTIYDRVEIGDVTYFTGGSWLEPGDEGTFEVIGDYCVHSNHHQYPYELGVYVYKDDVAYSLKEAYDKGVVEDVYVVSGLEFITVHKAGEDVKLTHKCMDAFIRYKNYVPHKNSYVECEVYGETEDTAFFRAYVSEKDACMACICSQQRIGGYIFSYGYVIGPEDNPTGLYVLIDGELIPAPKAYEDGKVSVDDLVRIVGAGEDPYNVEAVVAERLGFPKKDSTLDEWEMFPYLYKERYAHYSYPSSFSAADPDYILVFAAREPGQPIEPASRIGDYAVSSSAAYGEHHGYYVYIPATGELHDLRSAVEDTADIEGIGEAFLHMGRRGGMIGDADKDTKLTVKDATYIQKVVAGIEVEDPYFGITNLIRDFDRDDDVNVKDATAIQKCVAGLTW